MNIDFEIGDEVYIKDADAHRERFIGCKGKVISNPNPTNNYIRVEFVDGQSIDFRPTWLLKEPKNKSQIEAFKNITNAIVQTFESKNTDYGDCYADGFKRFGPVQLVSRMYEKYCRIEHLLCHNSEAKVKDESVIDTLTDLATQAIILRMLVEDNGDDDVDFEDVR